MTTDNVNIATKSASTCARSGYIEFRHSFPSVSGHVLTCDSFRILSTKKTSDNKDLLAKEICQAEIVSMIPNKVHFPLESEWTIIGIDFDNFAFICKISKLKKFVMPHLNASPRAVCESIATFVP